ncbi:SHOCT domain-containing protein [Williamwhitmania taraxaci]|uniref:Short C-terminal domain-containing protein n=1 Tax=Williamwhitmania taraxaci TaxID=1640674 RepID=A0A1G6NM93_9BACT|nr:SHOCT domain-containing protein [Williamwhitmania taraxaci]SDC68849.1 Short C-terminal domain-containing protein [Williamwhitmania taraxaci]
MIFFGGLLIIVVFLIIRSNLKSKRITKLRLEYRAALKGTNKARAVTAGRAYYSAVRNGRLTIYDEQAINNDMSTMNTEIIKSEVVKSSDSSIDKLERLAQLKAQGILTDEEFNQQKSKVLSE